MTTTYIFTKKVQHTAKKRHYFLLEDASADNRYVAKFELKEVTHLIQNTIQKVNTF